MMVMMTEMFDILPCNDYTELCVVAFDVMDLVDLVMILGAVVLAADFSIKMKDRLLGC